MDGATNLIVLDSVFSSNGAASSAGAVYCYGSSRGSIVNSLFQDNKAIWGAGLYVGQASVVAVNSTIFRKNKPNKLVGKGGGIMASDNAQVGR